LSVPGAYTPADNTVSTIVFTADQMETDATPTDNTITATVTTNPKIFSRDNNKYDGGGLWNGNGNNYELGNLFEITNADTATSVTFVVTGSTDAGVETRVKLYDWNVSNPTELGVSDFHTITASEIPTGSSTNPKSITLHFSDNGENVGVILNPGFYVAVVEHTSAISSDLVIAEGTDISQPIQTSFLYDEATSTWFYVTSTPMVRLNFGHLGIPDAVNETSDFAGVNIYPNPTHSTISINASMNRSKTVQVKLVDVVGNVVFNDLVGQASAPFQYSINMEQFSKGVYFLQLITDSNTISRKVVRF
jgi:hypothetical protein